MLLSRINIPDWIEGDLPSWVAVGIAVVAALAAWYLRPTRTYITPGVWDLQVLDQSQPKVTLQAWITPHAAGFCIVEIECQFRVRRSRFIPWFLPIGWVSLISMGHNNLGGTFSSARLLDFAFRGDGQIAMPSEADSFYKLETRCRMKLADGTSVRLAQHWTETKDEDS